MAKRPRLSAHLRLATPPADEAAAASTPENAAPKDPAPDDPTPERPPPQGPAAAPPGDHLLAIATDAAAETTRLAWLGWSKAWELQLRLSRLWLGLDRKP